MTQEMGQQIHSSVVQEPRERPASWVHSALSCFPSTCKLLTRSKMLLGNLCSAGTVFSAVVGELAWVRKFVNSEIHCWEAHLDVMISCLPSSSLLRLCFKFPFAICFVP